jgi:hypothetical protein
MNGEEQQPQEQTQEQPQESQEEAQHSMVNKLVESFSQEGEKIDDARNQAMQTFINQLNNLVEEKEAEIKELKERIELKDNKAENFKRQLSELLNGL